MPVQARNTSVSAEPRGGYVVVATAANAGRTVAGTRASGPCRGVASDGGGVGRDDSGVGGGAGGVVALGGGKGPLRLHLPPPHREDILDFLLKHRDLGGNKNRVRALCLHRAAFLCGWHIASFLVGGRLCT